MRWLWILLIPVLTFIGCQSKSSSLPIPEDELVQVLLDAHTAEAALSYLYGTKRDTFAENYYEEIYQIHGISESDFRASVQALRNDPEYMKEVYTRLLAELDERVAD